MSNLNSIFDTLRGWPEGSALEASFRPDPNVTSLAEGLIVKTEKRQLAAAAVLKMIDDSLKAAPTLTSSSADAGKAYEIADRKLADAAVLKMKDDAQVTAPGGPVTGEAHEVAGTGGLWSGFTIGDIVEWDGAAWQLVLAQSGGSPPDGTRAVVIDTGAAGSFTGDEETIQACSSGTWTTADTPADTELVTIDAAGSIYDGQIWEYTGAHAAGSWGLSTDDWRTYGDGDIVEWSGTAWALVVAASAGDPPDGTRAVVISASAAGSFSGDEETVQACSSGTWTTADTPVNENRILISGTNGIFDGLYYEYAGTHATGAWALAIKQVVSPTVVSKLTSGAFASAVKPDAWLIIQGNDQWDASYVDKVTCLKMSSGCVYKIAHASADSLVAGSNVYSNAGVLTAATTQWPVGVVIYSNGTAGANGFIHVATS